MVRIPFLPNTSRRPQLVALHAEPSGELLGLAVGKELGSHRTGALGGLAVDLLARPAARTVGLVGAGTQAWTQVWAISGVRELAGVRVFSRDPGRRRAFAERVRAELGWPQRPLTRRGRRWKGGTSWCWRPRLGHR